jgi:hypothetical protein
VKIKVVFVDVVMRGRRICGVDAKRIERKLYSIILFVSFFTPPYSDTTEDQNMRL